MKKMRNFSIALFLALSLGLSGCSSSSASDESDNDDQVENSDASQTDDSETSKSDASSKAGVTEYNQVIANDDLFEITLTTIEYEEDSIFGDSIDITFNVVNKSDQTVEVQANELSIDNKMVDDSLPTMSQEISSGKSAECVLNLMSYDESIELPAMEENMELVLNIFSWDDWEFEHNYPVTVNFK